MATIEDVKDYLKLLSEEITATLNKEGENQKDLYLIGQLDLIDNLIERISE